VSLMDQAVDDRIGDRRLAERDVPFAARQLARGARAVTVFEDLEDVLALPVLQDREPPIIEDQDIGAGEAARQRG